jgi:hypothetical protein
LSEPELHHVMALAPIKGWGSLRVRLRNTVLKQKIEERKKYFEVKKSKRKSDLKLQSLNKIAKNCFKAKKIEAK